MLDVGELRRDKGSGMEPRLRADGRWESRYVAADGRRRTVYVRDTCSGPHPRRACAAAKTCAKLRDEGIAAAAAGIDPSLMPFADYLDSYLERRMNLQPASRERYQRLVRLHVRGSTARDERQVLIATKPVIRIRPDDIESLYLDRQAAGLAPKGIELLHTLIHGALARALERGRVLRNAASGAERPAVRRAAPNVLDGGELRRLMDAAVGHRLEAFVAVLATTGLRHGELLELTWSAVDLDRGQIVLANPEKGGVPRTLLLAPRVTRTLRAQKARIAETRLGRAGAWIDRDLVFPGTWGDRADRSTIGDQVHAIAAGAGLPPVTPRALRHAVATELLRRGVPMKVVQELLGHRTYKQTADTYAHVSETMQRMVVDAMTAAVGE